MTDEPAPKPAPRPLTPRQKLADRIAFAVIVIVGLLGTLGLLFSLLAAVARQADCDTATNACSGLTAAIGFWIGAILAGAVLLAMIIVVIVRWLRGRIVWPIAIAAMVLVWIVLLVGQTIAMYAARSI